MNRADGADGAALLIAHDVLDQLAREMRRPSFRAGAAVTVAATIVLARLGARPSLVVMSSVLLGMATENLYGMAEAIAGSTAAAAAVPAEAAAVAAEIAATVRDLLGARDANPTG